MQGYTVKYRGWTNITLPSLILVPPPTPFFQTFAIQFQIIPIPTPKLRFLETKFDDTSKFLQILAYLIWNSTSFVTISHPSQLFPPTIYITSKRCPTLPPSPIITPPSTIFDGRVSSLTKWQRKREIFRPPSPSLRGCPKAYTPPPSDVQLFHFLWSKNYHIRMYMPFNPIPGRGGGEFTWAPGDAIFRTEKSPSPPTRFEF